MKLSSRSKNWLLVLLIIISGLLGGIIGNWLYVYVLDVYYDIPAGNYLTSPSSSTIIVRNPEKNTTSNSTLESVAVSESSIVGIFKRAALYFPENNISQGLVLTSDGWIVSPTLSIIAKESWKDYVVVTTNKKIYTIDRIILDPLTNLSFVHINNANNLPVKDFIASYDIALGQSLLSLEWNGIIQNSIQSHPPQTIRSSDFPLHELRISELPAKNLFLFDSGGRIVGFSRNTIVFSLDSVKNIFKKLLTDGDIHHARLGVHYINLDSLAAEASEGALIVGKDKMPAVVSGSPAQKAGLQAGDIITVFGSENVSTTHDLATLLTEYNPGDTVAITFLRKKAVHHLSITLDNQVEK